MKQTIRLLKDIKIMVASSTLLIASLLTIYLSEMGGTFKLWVLVGLCFSIFMCSYAYFDKNE